MASFRMEALGFDIYADLLFAYSNSTCQACKGVVDYKFKEGAEAIIYNMEADNAVDVISAKANPPLCSRNIIDFLKSSGTVGFHAHHVRVSLAGIGFRSSATRYDEDYFILEPLIFSETDDSAFAQCDAYEKCLSCNRYRKISGRLPKGKYPQERIVEKLPEDSIVGIKSNTRHHWWCHVDEKLKLKIETESFANINFRVI